MDAKFHVAELPGEFRDMAVLNGTLIVLTNRGVFRMVDNKLVAIPFEAPELNPDFVRMWEGEIV